MTVTGGGNPRSHDGRKHEEPECGPAAPSGVSSANEPVSDRMEEGT